MSEKPIPDTTIGWQPIATAPKDGTVVILTTGQASAVGRWTILYLQNRLNDIDGLAKFDRVYGWRSSGDKNIMAKGITHWMPLPTPPVTP